MSCLILSYLVWCSVHCQERMRPMQEMNHCRHGPGRFRKCDRPVLEIIDCRHGPACFRKCARPVMEITDCRHGPACFRKCARPVLETIDCRHGPACFRKCTKPKLETCVAGIGRLISGNVPRPVLVMVQATHFRRWHVPLRLLPAIKNFLNGPCQNFVSICILFIS